VNRRLRLFYFLYYGFVGAYLSYFAPYLRGLGFSGRQIGAVMIASQLVAAPAALAWGQLGDRLRSPSRALRLCALLALFCMAFLPFARTPLQVAAVLTLHALFGGAVVPLLDATTMQALRTALPAAGGRTAPTYARTRLFGSLGFILSAQTVGLLLSARGERPADLLVPCLMLLFVAGYAVLSQFLPVVAPSGARPHLREATALLRDRALLILLIACAIHWAVLTPYHLFFGVLVRDLGLPASLTGLSLALGVCAEVAAFFAFPLLERKLSLQLLFACSFAGTALRWLLLSRASSPVALASLQLLHALTFGLFWGCAVESLGRIVPSRLRATGQALFSALVFGAGNALGSGLSGLGYDSFGSTRPLFALAAGLELIPLALVVSLGAVLSRRPA